MSGRIQFVKRKSFSFHFVGDIESMPFIEALGQFSYRVGKSWFLCVCSLRYNSESLLKMSRLSDVFSYLFSGTDNFCLIHVSLVPVLNVVGEQASFSSLGTFV